jgi:hypothetical protein
VTLNGHHLTLMLACRQEGSGTVMLAGNSSITPPLAYLARQKLFQLFDLDCVGSIPAIPLTQIA